MAFAAVTYKARTAASSTRRAREPTRRPAGARDYRPALDGIRGVGIAAVLAEHLAISVQFDVAPLRNVGGVWLTVFFVLSGYLITGLLVAELRERGQLDLVAFYGRRAGRLLPALFVAVIVFTAAFVALGEWRALAAGGAALGYVGNWVLINDFNLMWPFGQTWSLAVEEHFYVLWPPILALVWCRWGARRALGVALAIALASFTWRVWIVLVDGEILAAARGTGARMDALLLGCAAALAIELGLLRRPGRIWLVPAFAVLVSMSWPAAVPELYMTVGLAATALAAVVLIVHVDHGPSLVGRFLATPPVVALGRISYSVYLLHWPLFAILLLLFGSSWPAWMSALAVGGALLLATASYHLVEKPFRRRVRRALARREASPRAPEPPVAVR